MHTFKKRFMKYSIIIPTYKHFEDCLKPCIESIIKYTDLSECEVIVVANGCGDDGTAEYLTLINKEYSSIWMMWFEEPLGYTRAVNKGLMISQGDYIVMLNNDTVLLEQPKSQWLEILHQPFTLWQSKQDAGITGPMKTMSESAGREFIIFFCVMISRKAFGKVGYLDEIFSPGYDEDTDYCLKAEQAGFKVIQVPKESNEYYADKRMTGEFPIYHKGNVTFKNWPDGDKLIERNNNILRERYNKPTLGAFSLLEEARAVYNMNKMAAELGMKGSPTGGPLVADTDRSKTSPNIERAKKCDGFMSDEELMWLAQQAKTHKVIVEVGSWHGKSSRAIADNLPADGVLYCVDHWKGSKSEQETFHASAKDMEGDAAYLEFQENCWDLISTGKIVPLRMGSENAAALMFKKEIRANMVFIDGGHTYEEVKKDILQWAKVLKTGSIICGHDYLSGQNPTWLEVKKAVDEIFSHIEVAPNTSIWFHVMGEPIQKRGMFAATTGGGSAVYKNGERIEGKATLFHYPKEEQEKVKHTTWLSKGSTLTYLDADTEPKVFDCFPFFNELDILEIRLNELYDVVDRFVIVEARVTHGGQPKPLHWQEHFMEQRFYKFLHKITYLVVEEFPEGDSWARERYQRDYIMKGLEGCKDNDIIIISDVDEIPKAGIIAGIKEFHRRESNVIHRLEMDLYYYYLNCKATIKWAWAKTVSYKKLKQLQPCGVRYYEDVKRITMHNAGWHLSYFGGAAAIIEKIKATAHQEYNTLPFTDKPYIEVAIKKGVDLFGRPLEYEWIDCFHKGNYPAWLEKSNLFTTFVNMSKA